MSDYDDTNTFVLFSEEIEEGSKKPNCTGKINIDGKEMRLAGWSGESKNGRRYVRGTWSEYKAKATEPAKEEAPF